MKIVFVTRHCCMRATKEALVLNDKGHALHLITEKLTQYADTAFKTTTVYATPDHLRQSIKLFPDADLFHVHNEPSWYVTTIKDIFPDKPVVLDVHDSMLLRRTREQVEEAKNKDIYRISVDERNNILFADGLVYVCTPMKELVEKEFAPDAESVVLPSYVPRGFYRDDFKQWFGGLVYDGRIDTVDELPEEWKFFQYSNYIPLARKCVELKLPFHVYTARTNEPIRNEYAKHCILHPPLNYERLIKALGSHEWGLVGNIDKHEEWKHALPNKLFEYMAACIPIVAINADECSKLIEEFGVGITVSSLEELKERWDEWKERKRNVLKHRSAFALDDHICKLEELYESIT